VRWSKGSPGRKLYDMGVRVRVCCLLAIAVCALAPSTAGAFSISGFGAERQDTKVAWRLITCGSRGYEVTFQISLSLDSGVHQLRQRRVHFQQHSNCEGWELAMKDVWAGGLWDTRITAFSRGQVRRTPWILLDNGEEE